jgi:hypothetical protein
MAHNRAFCTKSNPKVLSESFLSCRAYYSKCYVGARPAEHRVAISIQFIIREQYFASKFLLRHSYDPLSKPLPSESVDMSSLRKRPSLFSLRSRASTVNSKAERRTIRHSRDRLKTFAKRSLSRVKHLRHHLQRRDYDVDKLAVQRVPVQTISFLDLPYELREHIYVYAFASSKIHYTVRKEDRGWDCLAMTCHQIRAELDAIPIRLLIAPIEATWAKSGAMFHIHVSTDGAKREDSKIIIRVPRSECRPLAVHSFLLLRLISVVLTFKTARTTIALYDDGTRLLSLPDIKVFLCLTQSFLFLRITDYDTYSQCNTVNTKEVVVLWAGHLHSYWVSHQNIITDLFMARLRTKIPISFVWPGTTNTYSQAGGLMPVNVTQGIAIVSETRFRPARGRRKLNVRSMHPVEFRQRYQEDLELNLSSRFVRNE